MRNVVIAVVALVACGAPADAQSAAAPSPSPAPTPIAFSVHAHAAFSAAGGCAGCGGTARLGIEQRDNLTRIDVLAVRTGALSPYSVTVVIDRRAATVTAWNDRSRTFYVQPVTIRMGAAPSPSPSPSPSPTATPQAAIAASPFRHLDVLDLTLHLTGHTTTAGIPTTGLALTLDVKKDADPGTFHLTASTQLADEFAAFPMSLEVGIAPAGAPLQATLSYAVDDLTRRIPDAHRFVMPAGYAKASSLFAVFFGR